MTNGAWVTESAATRRTSRRSRGKQSSRCSPRSNFRNARLASRGSNTNCLCFALRSSLIRPPSTFQSFFTFTLLPGSSDLLPTPECSEYHLSERSPVVSALSLTRLRLSGTNSVRHSTSVTSYTSSFKIFIFLKTFSLVPLP